MIPHHDCSGGWLACSLVGQPLPDLFKDLAAFSLSAPSFAFHLRPWAACQRRRFQASGSEGNDEPRGKE